MSREQIEEIARVIQENSPLSEISSQDVGEALYNAHTAYVFLDGLVKSIVLLENATECGHCLSCNKKKTRDKNRNDYNEGCCKCTAHNVRHYDREDKHQRAADCGTDDHHIGHLYVSNVGRKSCYERRCREVVNVLKGVGLDLAEKIAAKILCESRARLSASKSRNAAATKRKHRHYDEKSTRQEKLAHFGARLNAVYEVSGYEGDENFNNDLADNEDKGQYRGELIFPDTAHKSFYHCVFPFCPLGKIYRIIYYTKNKLKNQYVI